LFWKNKPWKLLVLIVALASASIVSGCTKNETEEKSESIEDIKEKNNEEVEKNEDIDDDVQREVKEGIKSKRVYHIICFNNEKIYDIE
jgi:hypothetical protein